MGVPESIRKVSRPKNTVVIDNGADTLLRYAVRERAGIKYVSGGNPQPQNGKVIGHIINGEYKPLEKETTEYKTTELSYGSSVLLRDTLKDVISDLCDVYPIKDAYAIATIAALRVMKPKISSSRLQAAYERSFLSVFYPGISISKNSISDLFDRVGRDGKKREDFYSKRMNAVANEHHIVVDGTLKQDTSTVNDLSAFSYKSRTKGCKDISVLYAYNLELMEPICAQVFPGNSIDASSYESFVKTNNITKGIILADKGFPASKIKKILSENKDLHYFNPIKRNDKRIEKYGMLEFNEQLNGIGEQVIGKKVCTKDGSYLYSYMDATQASNENKGFFAKSEKNKSFDFKKYKEKKETFGVIVFESDQDLSLKQAYLLYDSRWTLEMVFGQYKGDECLDRTREHGDFSVIGSEFVNFIATLASCRILNKARDTGLLHKMTFGDLIEDLNVSWRRTDAPENALREDGFWIHTLPSFFEEMELMGIIASSEKLASSKKGRKPKLEKTVTEKPKRPRGRPRKNSQTEEPVVKHPVGRPRKKPVQSTESTEKRKRGRPRKLDKQEKPKRPVGRPRKNVVQ